MQANHERKQKSHVVLDEHAYGCFVFFVFVSFFSPIPSLPLTLPCASMSLWHPLVVVAGRKRAESRIILLSRSVQDWSSERDEDPISFSPGNPFASFLPPPTLNTSAFSSYTLCCAVITPLPSTPDLPTHPPLSSALFPLPCLVFICASWVARCCAPGSVWEDLSNEGVSPPPPEFVVVVVGLLYLSLYHILEELHGAHDVFVLQCRDDKDERIKMKSFSLFTSWQFILSSGTFF